MIPSQPLDDLASRLRARIGFGGQTPWFGPYILFLGERCARAAGAPSAAHIAREVLATFGFEKTAGAEKGVTDEWLLQRYAQHTSSLSRRQIGRMLQSIFARVPVPSFYQDLAQLIREGFFPLILTTNFDTLLEQALAGVGIRASDYRVTTFGPEGISPSPDSHAPQAPLTHLVKLHGDLAQDIAHFLPEDVERALSASRQWIKSDLRGDIVMVGHVLSDDPLDRWLTHSSQRELWWVDEAPPPDPSRVATWTSDYHEVTGDLGRPQAFFPQLVLRVFRAPRSMTAAQFDGEAALEGIDLGGDAGPAPEGPALSEVLQRELLRSQTVLYNLEHEGGPGDRPSTVQTQIEYQKRHVSKIEDRIWSLPDVRPRVLELARRISARVSKAASEGELRDSPAFDYSVLGYLDTQITTLEGELRKEKPNPFLVSASLGATLNLADRLATEYGIKVVDPEDVKGLAALAPSAASKVVL